MSQIDPDQNYMTSGSSIDIQLGSGSRLLVR